MELLLSLAVRGPGAPPARSGLWEPSEALFFGDERAAGGSRPLPSSWRPLAVSGGCCGLRGSDLQPGRRVPPCRHPGSGRLSRRTGDGSAQRLELRVPQRPPCSLLLSFTLGLFLNSFSVESGPEDEAPPSPVVTGPTRRGFGVNWAGPASPGRTRPAGSSDPQASLSSAWLGVEVAGAPRAGHGFAPTPGTAGGHSARCSWLSVQGSVPVHSRSAPSGGSPRPPGRRFRRP